MAEAFILAAPFRRAGAATALFAAAPIVLAVCAPPAQATSRFAGFSADALPALTYATGVTDEVTPAPAVTSPSESVAAFSIAELPVLASLVVALRADVVALARIGGLYGP